MKFESVERKCLEYPCSLQMSWVCFSQRMLLFMFPPVKTKLYPTMLYKYLIKPIKWNVYICDSRYFRNHITILIQKPRQNLLVPSRNITILMDSEIHCNTSCRSYSSVEALANVQKLINLQYITCPMDVANLCCSNTPAH